MFQGSYFLSSEEIPVTSFSCKGRPTGYYADLETGCQVIRNRINMNDVCRRMHKCWWQFWYFRCTICAMLVADSSATSVQTPLCFTNVCWYVLIGTRWTAVVPSPITTPTCLSAKEISHSSATTNTNTLTTVSKTHVTFRSSSENVSSLWVVFQLYILCIQNLYF